MVLSLRGAAHVAGLAFGLMARLELLRWRAPGFLAYAVCLRGPASTASPAAAQATPLFSRGQAGQPWVPTACGLI
jgi:hypothetical protein